MNSGKGRVGVLIPGMGAVATTLISGVFAIRRNMGLPIGSLTELGDLEIQKGVKKQIKSALPICDLDDFVFGGWDVHGENAYEVACRSNVLDKTILDQLKSDLENVTPMDAVFDPAFVKYIDYPNRKAAATKYDLAQLLREDIREFKRNNQCDRLVMVWCGSTESYTSPGRDHESLASFEKAMKENSSSVAPSMIYLYAALMEGVPFANGAPNLSVELPCMQQLAEEKSIPLAGSDFKTGQTLMKTIIAPGLKSRMISVDGWFSTNILGNRDGQVLQDPGSFKSKEVSKLGVLDSILEPERHPELYGDMDHAVRINYYRPRGDAKEGWDNIDIKGWLGYPMQIKVNFLCRDSILAAPIVLDLIQFLDLSARAGLGGIQKWLSFYWKDPAVREGDMAIHALHEQHELFQEELRQLYAKWLSSQENVRKVEVSSASEATI